MATPKNTPIQLKEFTCNQSHYGDIVPKSPTRSMLVAPSGAGKTVLLTNMILDIYKGCFSRIYIFGVHLLKWIIHGNQLRIISEMIVNQVIEKNVILIHMSPVS